MTINYELVEYNVREDYIIIRPKHPLFRQHPDSYPCYNVAISELDQTQDISLQLAQRSLNLTANILKEENPDGYNKLQEFLVNNVGKDISTPVPELKPVAWVDKVTENTPSPIVEGIDFIN